MQRGALPAACLILAALVGAAAPTSAAAALPTRSPLATYYVRDVGFVVSRLDPVTLAPRGPRVVLGEYHGEWSVSPDGTQIGFSISAPTSSTAPPPPGQRGRIGLRIIEMSGLRVVRDVQLGGYARGLAWVRPDRLVAGRGVVVNPETGQVLRRPVGPLGRCRNPLEAGATEAPKALLLPTDWLMVVDENARVRTVSLRGLPHECGWAGMAVDPSRNRLFIVGRGAVVAEIDLASLRAVARRVAGPSLPVAERASAAWLGEGLIAVGRLKDGRPRGVSVVDTRSWTRTAIDEEMGAVSVAGSRLLAFDGGDPRFGRSGVRAYSFDGRRLWGVLRGTHVERVLMNGDFAYAEVVDRIHVIDLREGRIVRSSPKRVEFPELIPG